MIAARRVPNSGRDDSETGRFKLEPFSQKILTQSDVIDRAKRDAADIRKISGVKEALRNI
jgi:hypothetical protein